MPGQASPITARELDEIERANASQRTPVVFVHGLWLLAGSWDPWRELFESRGYSTLAPGWPDDPEMVEEGRAHPELFAGKGVGAITDHFAAVIERLDAKPASVGHSFGGLITQKLAGRGLASVSVPIDPGPFRGVLPLPRSSLKASFPVLGNPANRKRSVMLATSNFDSRSPMRSTNHKPGGCMTPTRCQVQAYPCSKQRSRTSTRRPRRASTRRIPIVDR
jgi:non-heme chloroperoxidase